MNTEEHGQFNELLIRVNPCFSVALLVRVVPWSMSQETDRSAVASVYRSVPRHGSTFTRAAPRDNPRTNTDQDNHG
jgi:hypothetical protein